jgi:hypothetical protein
MADATLSVVTATLAASDAGGVSSASYATGDTITIYGPSAGELDFNSLMIRIVSATQSTITNTLSANSEFTGGELGDYSFSIASSDTVYIGGKGFEGSRFKQTGTSGTAYVEIEIAASSDIAIEAVQAPYSYSG